MNKFYGLKVMFNECDSVGLDEYLSCINEEEKKNYYLGKYLQTCNNIDVVNVLLKHGASTSLADERGMLPIHYLCLNVNDLKYDVIKAHVDAGCDINYSDKDGRTPLFQASFSDTGDAILPLMLNGADSSIPDNDGRYPFYANNQSWKTVEVQELILQNSPSVICEFRKCNGSFLPELEVKYRNVILKAYNLL